MRLLHFPQDARLLRRRADPLPESAFGTDSLRIYASELGRLLVAHEGMGLAATQVDFDPAWRIVVIAQGSNYSALCNPEIVSTRGESWATEGCLSFASVPEPLPAPAGLVVRYRSVDGKRREVECDINGARCVAHEVDHLNGKLIIDRMGELQRRIFLGKVYRRRRAGDDDVETPPS
jgi:peptide deformylase